jgi:hypothetical protein
VTAASALHGTWRLSRWDYTVNGEPRGFPMGEDAIGQIIYSPDGHMSAILSVAERPPVAATAFHQATTAERNNAALTYVSYAGTWDLTNDVVTHHVSFALFPNWVGTDLERSVTWAGETLILTGVPETTASGKTVVNRLFWQRATQPPTPRAIHDAPTPSTR